MPKIFARHRAGFVIEFDNVDRERIDETVTWLLHAGYRPDATGGDQWCRTPAGSPICGRHQVAMTKRERRGDSWWSHAVTDPATGETRYCRGHNTGKPNDGYQL